MIDDRFPQPDYPQSSRIQGAVPDRCRCHKGNGDMWPLTWAADGHLYGGAGDNQNSPMNVWRIEGDPNGEWGGGWGVHLYEVSNRPVEPSEYCRIPPCDAKNGIKPAGLLSLNGLLYMAVEGMNYGEDPAFNRQRNVHGWIITSRDAGRTWDATATPPDFFEGRVSSCHFVQFGKDYEGARDDYVYAHFPVADDGNSYWENGDGVILGRVPKDLLLERSAWEFCSDLTDPANPLWSDDDDDAVEVFRYPCLTGENHVSYNRDLDCYLMGNYAFVDDDGSPFPYHSGGCERSQLTLFAAPEPWGPWSIFYRDDNWGTYGDYQPVFPTKWMADDGRTVWLVSSGTHDDYNFTYQKFTLQVQT